MGAMDQAIEKLQELTKDKDPKIAERARRMLKIAKGEAVPDADARAGSPRTYADFLSRPEVRRHLDRALAANSLSEDERRRLAALDDQIARSRGVGGQGPHMEGTRLVLEYCSPEAAAARVREMLASGEVPAHAAPSVLGKTFRTGDK